MTTNTKIEWADHTWNPTNGCDRVSPGCDFCYAESISERFRGTPAYPEGFALTLHPERLDYPLKKTKWKHGDKIFVNSMSDLFHRDIPRSFLADVFATMLAAGHPDRTLTFLVLTKRHREMHEIMNDPSFVAAVEAKFIGGFAMGAFPQWTKSFPNGLPECFRLEWPLPNVWLGVSVENQAYADMRIPYLLGTPAARRFVSTEPLLGPVDFTKIVRRFDGGTTVCDSLRGRILSKLDEEDEATYVDLQHGLDWIIGGGESGPSARPCHPSWARSLRDQCVEAHVPFFWKQWGTWRSSTIEDATTWIRRDGSTSPCLSDDATPMKRSTKHETGRVLDGREWSEFPEAVTV